MQRPLKKKRYDKLSREGFLPFEARALSRNRLSAPGMKELRAERRMMLKQAKRQFVEEFKKKPTRKGVDPVALFYRQWKAKIMNLYSAAKWIDNSGKWNPYARLREIGDIFKYTHPDFRTPLKKTKSRVTPGEYQRRAEKTRKYTITVTYEIAAGSQKEAEEQAKRQVHNIKRLKVSEVD